jgi:YD repeat-containing protein
VSRTDALGNIRYSYDKRNRVIGVKDPQNRDTLYRFDAEGNPTETVAPGDTEVGTRTIAYGADILNRRTSMNQAAGPLVYNYGYDAEDQLTSLADPAAVRTQGYDEAGRLISVSRDDKAFTYGYDSNGNVRSRTWPDGTTVTSTFTTTNQLATLTVAGGQAGSAAQYSFEYDPSGRLKKTTDRAYDRAGRLADLHSRNDYGTVARYQLTRDPSATPPPSRLPAGTTASTLPTPTTCLTGSPPRAWAPTAEQRRPERPPTATTRSATACRRCCPAAPATAGRPTRTTRRAS